jgi:GT2 family glycosyltransferase
MVFIVIPVFNRREFTRNCLLSLTQQTYRNLEVIVVDDGSTDGTSEMIEKEFPNVILIKGDGNLWWAGATNKGIEYVLQKRKYDKTDFILTLNNDLEVPDDYLEKLVYNSTIYKKAILGSVSVDISAENHMDFCGIKWNEFTGKYYSKARAYHYSYDELKRKEQVIHSDMLPGRGTLIPIEVFSEVGLFDSINFPQYAADEDFTLRAKRKGWDLLLPTNVYLKSYITHTGIDTTKIQFKVKYFKELFFSLRSPLNLKVRYRFALKNTKTKTIYFIIGLIRISLSLFKSLVSYNMNKLKSAK